MSEPRREGRTTARAGVGAKTEGGRVTDPVTIIRRALGIEREAVGVKYTDDVPAVELAEGRAGEP